MNLDGTELLRHHEWAARPRLWPWQRLGQLGLSLSLGERRLLLAAVDLLLLNGALLAALLIWTDFHLPAAALLANSKWFLTLSGLWFILAAALDVYNPARAASVTQSLLYVGIAALLTGLLYLTIPWLTPPVVRRLQAFGFVLLAGGSLLAWRAFYARFFYQPAFYQRVIIVSSGPVDRSLVAELQAAAAQARANPFRGSGYVLVGLVEPGAPPAGEAQAGSESLAGVPRLSPDELVYQARRRQVHEIIVAGEAALPASLRDTLLDCCELGLQVTPLALAYERLTARMPVELAGQVLGLVTGSSADSPGQRLFRLAKRLVDLGLGLVGLSLLLPLAPLVALANAFTSPGPLFYTQHRVGRGGRPFVMVKFRTMRPDAEKYQGAVWAEADDPRITPLGRWLRRTRLDELPQIINVLKGEMSVVGPRPERPQFVGELVHCLPLYRARHAMRPGITGWAQVRYRYGNSLNDAKTKLEYDLYYIKHAGLFLDLLIFLQTVPVMLQFKGY